jgi:hypothetical protein
MAERQTGTRGALARLPYLFRIIGPDPPVLHLYFPFYLYFFFTDGRQAGKDLTSYFTKERLLLLALRAFN